MVTGKELDFAMAEATADLRKSMNGQALLERKADLGRQYGVQSAGIGWSRAWTAEQFNCSVKFVLVKDADFGPSASVYDGDRDEIPPRVALH